MSDIHKLCSCCLELFSTKNLWTEYEWMGHGEVYGNMINECFGLNISRNEQLNAMICETCIILLRMAVQFKRKFLDCRNKLAAHIAVILTSIKKEDVNTNKEVGALKEGLIVPKIENFTANEEEVGALEHDEVSIKMEKMEEDGEMIEGSISEAEKEKEYRSYEISIKMEDTGEIEEGRSEVEKEKDYKNFSVKLEDKQPKTKTPKMFPGAECNKIYKPYTDDYMAMSIEVDTSKIMNQTEVTRISGIQRKKLANRLADKNNEDTDEDVEPNVNAKFIDDMEKHKDNIRSILEGTNATPIKGYRGIGYACCFCEQPFMEPMDLKLHTFTHVDRANHTFKHIVKLDITLLQCSICDKKIPKLENAMEHLKNYHEKPIHLHIKSEIIPFKFDTKILTCALCPEQFDNFKLLSEHMNVHYRNYECSKCDRGFINKHALTAHRLTHHPITFTCSYCSNVSYTRIMMEEHERTHSKTLKCGYCDEKFVDVAQKAEHECKKHSVPLVSYKCTTCEKTFNRKSLIMAHVKRVHLGVRPHKCLECGIGFYDKKDLKLHSVKHTGAKEFECEICLKRFGLKKSLNSHMKLHESQGTFPFRCTD